MEIYTMTKRPSVSLIPACAPFAPAPVAPAPASVWAPAQAVRPVTILAAERAPVSRVHQVQVQAELAQALALGGGINGTTGTTGFMGTDGSKRYTDGASGVPPRGRPV